MKKKILIIGPNPNSWGGVATCSREIENAECMKDSYTFSHLSTWNNGKWIGPFIKSLIIIKKISKDVDLIHFNLSKNGSTYRKLILSHLIKNKKYIVHIHYGEYGKFYKNCNSFIKKHIVKFLEKAERIVFVSQYQKEEFFNEIKLNNNNIQIIYNGIELTSKTPSTKDYLQVLYFGSISKNRHIDEYIDLANNLSNNNIRFVLAGDGLINKLNLNNIEYLGFVANEEKEKLLNDSDIIYDYFSESFGLGLLEAMNHYACPLVYPLGSIPEIIGNNEFGLIFKNNEDLKEKLIYLKENKNILKEYQIKAHNRSLMFSKEKYTNSFKFLYNEVLKNE